MAYRKIINGQLALGYGSKYQLLRMLGWHRDDFNKKVMKALSMDGTIHWFDFHYDEECDKELLNVEFLPQIDTEWKEHWACGSGGINWDAVGITDDGTYILVEAKAHLTEMKNSASGSPASIDKNKKRIAEVINHYGIKTTPEAWMQDNYQLANRIVITHFLQSKGLKVKLIYVLFENGYHFNRDNSESVSEKEWNNEMNRELEEMRIKNTEAESLVNWCIINCAPPKIK
ncbi:MAG: hypothetical protein E7611_01080 [Ruminococcaceae bacterium]|nr:hypothetical protein [Oscillospiraceae bacterium]